MDVYREQQMFSASGGLSIKQNLDWTGGTFYIDSEPDQHSHRSALRGPLCGTA